ACGDPPRVAGSAPSGIGPDAVLLRVPSDGGVAQAFRLGSDSVLWESRERAPATSELLGFDDFQGVLLGAGRDGRVYSVDLRLGSVTPLSSERLGSELKAEGGAVFGLDDQGRVLRLTQVAAWSWNPRGGADEL